MRGIHGRVAVIKWAYYTAAAVEGYALSQESGGAWICTGALVPGRIDAFKLAQRPLFFVAPFKGGAWRWEIKTLDRLDHGHFRAALGPMSTEDVHGVTRP